MQDILYSENGIGFQFPINFIKIDNTLWPGFQLSVVIIHSAAKRLLTSIFKFKRDVMKYNTHHDGRSMLCMWISDELHEYEISCIYENEWLCSFTVEYEPHINC